MKKSVNGSGMTLVGIGIESVIGKGWRIVDGVRQIRTPWLHDSAFSEATKKAAMYAVARTERDKLTHRHTIDGDWIVVHSY